MSTSLPHLAAYFIFGLTYLLIASRRLRLLPIGRPAGALLGALLMVAAGVLTPEQSFRAIDAATILLLFAMMLLTAYLELAGFFEWFVSRVLAAVRRPRVLLALTAAAAAGLSAFLVNDAICLFLTPVLLRLCRRGKLPYGPFLLALATSSNIGSAATLVGNPQNMIIGSLSSIPFARFLALAAPAALVGLLINIVLLDLYYGRRLPKTLSLSDASPDAGTGNGLALALIAAGLIVIGFFCGGHLGYTALAGVMLLVMAQRREPSEALARVDWSVLVFFCGLFIVVAGLAKTGVVEVAWAAAAPHMELHSLPGAALFTALMTVGSNLVSNVPMVLLSGPYLDRLGSAELGWVLLAFTTTIAGNLTLIGSVANIIVAERAKAEYALGFWEYLRFGLVSTVLVLAAGVPLIVLIAG